MKRQSTKRHGEFALVWICVLVAVAIATAVVRRGTANWGLYAMLGVILLALLTFTQRRR